MTEHPRFRYVYVNLGESSISAFGQLMKLTRDAHEKTSPLTHSSPTLPPPPREVQNDIKLGKYVFKDTECS